MGGEQNGFAGGVGKTAEELQCVDAACNIEERCRLVENDEGRFLCKSFCNHHLLPLAIAKFGNKGIGLVRNGYALDGLLHHTAVVAGETAEEACVRLATKRHEFAHGETPRHGAVGEHH